MKKKTDAHLRSQAIASLMHKKREPKIATSFRISKSSYDVMYRLSERMGISRGAILELALYNLDQLDQDLLRRTPMREAQ